MSTTQTETVDIVRTFDVELQEGDGRTIDAMICPFNVIARVADPPDFIPYDERFVAGAFERQTKAADRILLDFEHQDGIGGVIGRALTLEERSDGAYASFRLLDHSDSDKALELVRSGVLTGMSVMGRAIRSRIRDGVVERVRVHLDRVALCRNPAYATAGVLAVRQKADHDDEQEVEAEPVEVPTLLPPSADRLARFGVEPPTWAVRKDT